MKKQKILLVDDDPIILYMHQAIIKDFSPHSEILCMENGKLALDYIGANADCNFLLFLDINMPVMTGWGFLDALALSERRYQINVFIVTSSVNETDRIKSLAYPDVFQVIVKPLKCGILDDIKPALGMRFSL